MKNYLVSALLSLFMGSSILAQDNAIKLVPVNGSPEFANARLTLLSPEKNTKTPSAEVTFKYALSNYKLSEQTSDAVNKHCNNSSKGQHIHLILNNEPYLARYDTLFTEKLKSGRYIALSFLSRSYHESIKTPSAFDLREFVVGDSAKTNPSDLSKPLMFYSRPKGEYSGGDTENILLDFYLANVKLSKKGYKVKATINGKEFIITQWQGYFIQGLPKGESTIQLELIDKKGKRVDAPFNPVVRKITLK